MSKTHDVNFQPFARTLHFTGQLYAAVEKHWHGATPITGMTHITIHENLHGKVVDWMKQVTDEEYNAKK